MATSTSALASTELAKEQISMEDHSVRQKGNHDASEHRIPETSTSHPKNPIPEEPSSIPHAQAPNTTLESGVTDETLSALSPSSTALTSDSSHSETERSSASTAHGVRQKRKAADNQHEPSKRAATKLISSKPDDVRRILGDGQGTTYVGRVCCGGKCKFVTTENSTLPASNATPPVHLDTPAFESLNINLNHLTLDTALSNITDLPPDTVAIQKQPADSHTERRETSSPPSFVKPHPPYDIFLAPVFNARELTKSGAQKRTYHLDLDVTDYPAESGDVDFVVGGAIGVCPPNAPDIVDEILDRLGVPFRARDASIIMSTQNGRWPTIWGEEEARILTTTRRELLTWCTDVQSLAPTKALLRLLAEYASEAQERKVLMYLASAQGQAAFCDLRTGPPITLLHLLRAFPSSQPPLPSLLSQARNIMPRFYSLSQDPLISCQTDGTDCRKIIEIAVTVHELLDPSAPSRPYRSPSTSLPAPPTDESQPTTKTSLMRTGPGSGFLERIAREVIDAKAKDPSVYVPDLKLRVPMFRGLMANPFAKEFAPEGPMLLIGAGVGIAPFRGFVQRRLRAASCANKVWVIQGVRDSLLDELYGGEWGVAETQVRTVVQSRRGEGRYVQDEVRRQADLVWFVINADEGRVFLCGSSQGMGEGVQRALTDVAMEKGNLNETEAAAFWKQKTDEGQFIAETW